MNKSYLIRGIVYVLPIPEVFILVGEEMVFGYKGEEAAAALRVAGVHRLHTDVLQTDTCRYIQIV